MNESSVETSMSIGASLRHLGDILDEWDGDAVTIESVRVSDEIDLASGEDVSAAVSLSIDLSASDGESSVVVDATPSVTGEDTLALDLETSISFGHFEEYDVVVDPGETTLHSDGTVAVEVELALETSDERETDGESAADVGTTQQETEYRPSAYRDSGTDGGGHSTDASSDGGRRDVPPFKDPGLLRDVYENHDTFAEMADAIEMDVTGETVRRYMIDCEIHEPNSYRTDSTTTSTSGGVTEAESCEATESPAAGDSAPSTADAVHSESGTAGQSADPTEPMERGEKTLVSDGIGIPDSVEIDELIDAVNRSRTIHEVSRDLDFDRREARDLLTELNLLDLVLGRIDNDPNRTISREDVIDRLRSVSHPEA